MSTVRLTRSQIKYYNGYILSGVVLSEDCLVQLLARVDDITLCSCKLICKVWKNIISGHQVWSTKLSLAGVSVPRTVQQITTNYFRSMYFNHQFGKNCLKNNDGSEDYEHWRIDESGGDGWIIENPPIGCEQVPDHLNTSSCFVTSYGRCRKSQIIIMQDIIPLKLLEICKPTICVADWYTSRWDCGSKYTLKIEFLDKNNKTLDEIIFSDNYTNPTLNAKPKWRTFFREIKKYSDRLYAIKFSHWGKDLMFWAGHYGCKMTGSELKLKF